MFLSINNGIAMKSKYRNLASLLHEPLKWWKPLTIITYQYHSTYLPTTVKALIARVNNWTKQFHCAHVIGDIIPLSVLFKFAMQLIETLLDANQKFQP